MDYTYMGARIRDARRKCGMTQASLAKAAGVSTSYIGHIERGSRKASLDTAVRISQTLRISLDALIMPIDTNDLLLHCSPIEKSRLLRVLEAAVSVIEAQ